MNNKQLKYVRPLKTYKGYYSVSMDYNLLFDLLLENNEIICWMLNPDGSCYALFTKEIISNQLEKGHPKYPVIMIHGLNLIFDLRKKDAFENFKSFCKERTVMFILNKKNNYV